MHRRDWPMAPARSDDQPRALSRQRAVGPNLTKPVTNNRFSGRTVVVCDHFPREGGSRWQEKLVPMMAAVAMLLGSRETRLDLLLGILHTDPGGTLHRLARLEVFVNREEMLDLEEHILPDVGEIAYMVASMVRRRHA